MNLLKKTIPSSLILFILFPYPYAIISLIYPILRHFLAFIWFNSDPNKTNNIYMEKKTIQIYQFMDNQQKLNTCNCRQIHVLYFCFLRADTHTLNPNIRIAYWSNCVSKAKHNALFVNIRETMKKEKNTTAHTHSFRNTLVPENPTKIMGSQS